MKISFCILILTGWLSLQAQDYKLNQRYPGYFINIRGDTIRGYILLTNKIENQRGAEFSNDAKGEKIKIHLLPGQIRGFKVKDRMYSTVEYGEPDPTAEHFLMIREEGVLTLFEYFRLAKDLYVGEGAGQRPATGDDEQYLQSEYVITTRQGKKFGIATPGELIRNAEAIFKDDQQIITDIRNKVKGYRYNDLPELVKRYNASHHP